MTLKLPCGVADFAELRQEQLAFVDHTGYLRQLEDSAFHVLFLRPRRFGKSLWLSILEHYYDVRFAERFAELFAGLEICSAPTRKHGQYLVLRFDFSAVRAGEDISLEAAFLAQIRKALELFLKSHRDWLPALEQPMAELARAVDPAAALQLVMTEVKLAGRQVYLLIDEYDNFTNALLSARQEEQYRKLVGDNGLLKTFFKGIKEWAGRGAIPRSFVTGVQPLLLSDLTSGFNIAVQASLEPEFAGMLGFTSEEVEGLVRRALAAAAVSSTSALPTSAELLELMRVWYDGYRFHYRAPRWLV